MLLALPIFQLATRPIVILRGYAKTMRDNGCIPPPPPTAFFLILFFCRQVENLSTKTTREGLCSHFLSRQKRGELVRVAVRSSEFRSPGDLSKSPVIMVGLDTLGHPFFFGCCCSALAQHLASLCLTLQNSSSEKIFFPTTTKMFCPTRTRKKKKNVSSRRKKTVLPPRAIYISKKKGQEGARTLVVPAGHHGK